LATGRSACSATITATGKDPESVPGWAFRTVDNENFDGAFRRYQSQPRLLTQNHGEYLCRSRYFHPSKDDENAAAGV